MHWSCARDLASFSEGTGHVTSPRNASPPSALTSLALFYHHLLMNVIPKPVQGQSSMRPKRFWSICPKIFAFCETLAYRYLLAYVADEPSPCEMRSDTRKAL